MADSDDNNIRNTSSIFGAAVGTLLILAISAIDNPSGFTKTLLALTASITVMADRLAQVVGRWNAKRRELDGYKKALVRTDEMLENPNTPEAHKADLLDKRKQIQLRSIDALLNPSVPQTGNNVSPPAQAAPPVNAP